VAARLHDGADVKAAAATLWARLERERDPGIAGKLAKAYAAVAGPTVERADAKDRSALVSDILVLAGHPFVMDASPLLSALKPATGEDFGANVGAAVHWAQQTYDIRPDRLRPPPLESWLLFTGSRRDINLNTAETAAGRIGDLGAIALGFTRPVREGGDLERQPLRPDAAGERPRALKSP
jgi:hypothetical protein